MMVGADGEPKPIHQLPDMNRPLVIVGHSAAIERIAQEIASAATSNATVLIAGESGVGRRLIARTIHDRSERQRGAFISVNCVCLPDARLESELFGQAEAVVNSRDHYIPRGRLEAANGGTLVLQDVGYLSWRLQGRLLRFSETHMVQRVGSTESTPSDVRLMAITHRRLVHAVTNQAFREDLFYRMNMIRIEVPPLRDRAEDVPALMRYFMCMQSARLGRPAAELSPDALSCLAEYDWPGNVRELKEVAERLVQTAMFDRVNVDALPATLVRRSMSRTMARWGAGQSVAGGPHRAVDDHPVDRGDGLKSETELSPSRRKD
jgi:DNA-binding NtrC family response regulator